MDASQIRFRWAMIGTSGHGIRNTPWVLEVGIHSFSWKEGGEWKCQLGRRMERKGKSSQSWCLSLLHEAGGVLFYWVWGNTGQVWKHLYKLKYVVYIEPVELICYISILESKSFFNSLWSLKHHDKKSQQLTPEAMEAWGSPSLFVKFILGIFWPAGLM